MKDYEEIIQGLEILSRYDDTRGDVSMSYERVLYAGPQDEGLLETMAAEVRHQLEDLRWEFDEDIGRWGWSK